MHAPRHPRPLSLLSLPALALVVGLGATACEPEPPQPTLAEGIYAPLGEVLPSASEDQKQTFARGLEVATQRFAPSQGLGPVANVSFCASCHEQPVFGGGGPRYRDFFLTGTELEDGSFIAGDHGGVLTTYGFNGGPIRPVAASGLNVSTHRNAIPFFGVGLLAELSETSILANVDEDDADGDGISGRPNYDRGFVGRFGRKSQTVSIEGFIRGPLNNHLGITSNPLTEAQKAALPVPSDGGTGSAALAGSANADPGFRQAAAPDEPLTDDDGIPDPELDPEALFDLVSFAMLLAAPEPEPLDDNPLGLRGRELFETIDCAACHVPTLESARGLVPAYSDLLLHDMGEDMADGIQAGLATGSEFRTQPLWGVVAVGPYLHDGRAETLDEAIRWHAGEAKSSRKQYEALSADDQAAVLEFLASLGGRDQVTDGLLPPDAEIPAPGQPGAPRASILADDTLRDAWLAGRAAFDRNIAVDDGLGPVFNGDGCRACHFDPVIGGAGPLGVNVIRHGTIDPDNDFSAPAAGTILHKLATWGLVRPEPTPDHNYFEQRQTPTLLGLGELEAVSADDILARQDPDDLDGDGVRGVAHVMPDGQLGRFGWKAQVPSLREFARDALSAEVGLTVPEEPGYTFGAVSDGDGVADPEVDAAFIDALTSFMAGLAAPVPSPGDPLAFEQGLAAFEAVGCASCHASALDTPDGPIHPYTDLLLHTVATDGALGIVDGDADQLMFRTPPLWGLGATGPYMHDGSAETVSAAIAAHGGEADATRAAYDALDPAVQATILAFLMAL